jgi:hypothetical protein
MANSLLIHDETPAITFHGLIFLDPAILPSGKASSRVLCDMFGNWAKSKRHTWTNREVALKHLSTTAFKRWHPLAVQLFVVILPIMLADDITDWACTLLRNTRCTLPMRGQLPWPALLCKRRYASLFPLHFQKLKHAGILFVSRRRFGRPSFRYFSAVNRSRPATDTHHHVSQRRI